MPNHVTNKIIFDVKEGSKVFNDVCPEGKFDFNLLIPAPLGLYNGNVGKEEKEDFKLNWYDWNIENWGTKWNAYNQTICSDDGNGKAYIKFDTAWSVAYPVIAAFANKFNIPFLLKYYDEGENFWGIEDYGIDEFAPDYISRLAKHFMLEGDRKYLCIELKGYDPDKLDDEE